MKRLAVQSVSLALIVLLAVATVRDVVRNGPTGLAIVSLAILGLLGFGVIGAITTRATRDE